MNWEALIQHGLISGAIFSAAMTVVVIVSLNINKEMWWQDYPPDVKAAWGPMSERAKKYRNVFAAFLFTLIIGGLALSTIRLAQIGPWESWFMAVLANTAIIIFLFNLVDAVIIDWLILLVIWPSLGVLPGTEGMAGYRDAKLHVTKFFKGFIFVAVGSLLTAGIALLFGQ